MPACHYCGCTEIDTDMTRGDSVCTGCGSVLEEHVIVSEQQFEENAHGGVNALGQFVGMDGKGGRVSAYYMEGESREATLRNARKNITWLGEQLRLNQHCMDTAFNFFKLALNAGLTRGRRNNLVTGACLYITCRTEGTPHMLIDFSDVLLVDVCELGRTYTTLANSLCINIPVMDPCIYLLRYASKLELGDSTHQVCITAARLLQRMKRDWMHLGRRPSGLCGAALMLAARIHGFSRSVQDVVQVVRVHHTTVVKRLAEFKNTASSALTLDEFMSVDLEGECDPPSFLVARTRDKERINEVVERSDISVEMKALQSEIDKELDDRKSRILAKMVSGAENGEELQQSQEGSETAVFVGEQTLSVIRDCVGDEMQGIALGRAAGNTTSSQDAFSELTPRLAEAGIKVTTDLMGITSANIESASKPNPTNHCSEDDDSHLENVSLDLEGIDDDEINSYIMSERETKFKTRLWLKLNQEFLDNQEQKRKLKEEAKLRAEREGKSRRYKKRKKNGTTSICQSANEVIEKIFQEKKMSNKINYSVLDNLNTIENCSNTSRDRLLLDDQPIQSNSPTMHDSVASTNNNNRSSTTSLQQRNKLCEMGGDVRENATASNIVPSLITDRLQQAQSNMASTNSVCEVYNVDERDDEFVEDEEYLDEEDDGMMSAVQLLNQHSEDTYGDENYCF